MFPSIISGPNVDLDVGLGPFTYVVQTTWPFC